MAMLKLGAVSTFALAGDACDLILPQLCPKSPEVTTRSGPVQGFDRKIQNQTVSTFWTIPFADPPVGELRFHYPRPLSRSWHKTYRNLTRAPACPQQGGGGDEDCLYLNVYTPRKAIGTEAENLLPVMFWIFGGGYTVGDAYSAPGAPILYDGGEFAGRHDVVVVTHNYRVNLLGFNTFTTGDQGQTGTQAMEDQRVAMRWTQDNIKHFGGAPDRVTIFGESAGAFSVHYHLVSSPSWPLFSQAISESGTSLLSWFFQPKDLAEDLFQSWADTLGCAAGASQLRCLQALPQENFTDPSAGFSGRSPSFPVFPVGPVIDGTEYGLLDLPSNLIQAGKHHKIPLVLGSNVDGGSLFAPLVGSIVPGTHTEPHSAKDVDLILDWTFTADDQEKIRSIYNPNEYGLLDPAKYYHMVSRVMRDLGFMCSDRLVARQWREQGLDTFLYTFSFNFGTVEESLPLGTFHGAELPFVWHTLLDLVKLLPGHGDVETMADIMTCQWATFAHTGQPSGGKDASTWPRNCEHIHGVVKDWPLFTNDEHYYSLTDSPAVKQLRVDNKYPDDERPSNNKCDMWDTVSYPWHNKKTTLVVV